MEEQTLTQHQINAVYLRCNAMPFQQLLDLCLNPQSGITIQGLREANYKKIGELGQRFTEVAEDRIWAGSQNTIASLMDYISKIEQKQFSDAHLSDAKKRLIELAKEEISSEWGQMDI